MGAGDIFDDLDSAAQSASSFGEELTNVPSGFKIALERWRALNEEGGPGGGISPSGYGMSGGSGSVGELSSGDYFNQMYLAIRDGVCWALVNCCSCGDGLSLAGAVDRTTLAGYMSGPYGGMSSEDRSTTIRIDNLYASDGDDFRRQVEKAMETSNYRATGSQFTNFSNGGSWRS